MQTPFFLTPFLAYGITILGIGLAIYSPKEIFSPLISLGGGLAVMGMLFLLCTPFSRTKIVFPQNFEKNVTKKPESNSFKLMGLFLGQSALFIISFIFFNTVVLQSHLNTRLQWVRVEDFFGILHTHILTLGIFPWFTYAILGVGLAYFSVCKNLTPLFYSIIIPNPKKRAGHFLHNYFSVVHQVAIFIPYLLLVGLTIVLLSEGMVGLFEGSSFLASPYRSLFLWLIIVFSFRRLNVKFVDWLRDRKVPMGGRLALYGVLLTFFLLGIQGLLELFSLPLMPQAPADIKSPLAGSFSESALHIRLMLLFWGWWGIWIPWMTSLIARFSIGFSIWRAIIQAVILPLVLFYCVIEKVSVSQWIWMAELFQNSGVEIIAGILCLSFILLTLGRVHNFSDFMRGMMLPLGKLPRRSLTKVISLFILILVTYMPGVYALGWVPAQVIATLSAGFMLTVITAFMGILGLELIRFTLFSERRAEF